MNLKNCTQIFIPLKMKKAASHLPNKPWKPSLPGNPFPNIIFTLITVTQQPGN